MLYLRWSRTILLILFNLTSSLCLCADNAPWLNGFTYRRAITITSTEALTNYTVSITLDTASLIAATPAKMQATGADIRITNSGGVVLLNHWIESGINTAATRIRTIVPIIPIGASTIYLYYGNTVALTRSSGEGIFPFWDDFEPSIAPIVLFEDGFETAASPTTVFEDDFETKGSVVFEDSFEVIGTPTIVFEDNFETKGDIVFADSFEVATSPTVIFEDNFETKGEVAFEDNFNDGDVNGWTLSGDASWQADTSRIQEGAYSARSGAIGNNQSSSIERSFTVALNQTAELTFYWSVSSQADQYGSDPLVFYIDGIQQNAIAGEVGWTYQSYLIPAGTHTLRWTYIKNASRASGSDAGWIDNIRIYNYPKNWATFGNSNWGLPTAGYNGSTWSARSGPIGNSQSSNLAYTFSSTLPTEVSFYWSVSSQADQYGSDPLVFYIDDVQQNAIAGVVDWTYQNYLITAGTHTLRWTYIKNDSRASNLDAGWIDQVRVQTYDTTWELGGDSLWQTDAGYASAGARSGRSGHIGNSQSTWIQKTFDLAQVSEVTFYWSVSSQSDQYGYDPLVFYIDGIQQNAIAGEVVWTYQSYLISAGTHILRWTYIKNGSRASGSDAGWIDNIRIYNYPKNWATWGGPNDNRGSNWGLPTAGYNGSTWSARSGTIGNGQSSNLAYTFSSTLPTEVSFYWSVSSQADQYGYDCLIFYIDDVQQNAIAGVVDWTYQNYLITAGTHTLRWTYSKNGDRASGLDAGWIDQVRVQTYDTTWEMGGDSLWQTDAEYASAGVRSGRSGHIGDNQSTWIQKTLNLAQVSEITFYWSVSSQADQYGSDPLVFYIDGIQQNAIAGEVGWTYQSYLIPARTHILRWTYSKNSSGASGSDAGWIDNIRIYNYPKNWATFGNSNWGLPTAGYNGSTWSARSGPIGNSQSSNLAYTFSSTLPTEVSFYWSVSSQADQYGYDCLIFYIDDVQQNAIAGVVDWTYQSYLIPAGQHILRWTYIKNGSRAAGLDAGWIDQVRVQTYDTTWEMGGDSLWQTDATYASAGARSGRSGHIGDNQSTWIQKTLNLTQVSEVSFYWSVSSQADAYGYDCLIFYIDGIQQNAIAGEVGWTYQSYLIPAGTHTLRWTYIKNASRASGSDAGWIDSLRVQTYDSSWELGGDSLWQTDIAYISPGGGTRSGRSGHIGNNQSTWIQKTLNLAQNSEVSFYWAVSSQADQYGSDPLVFYIDDVQQNAIAGVVDWTYQSYLIPAGQHILRWTYIKNGSRAAGLDAGWIDQVRVRYTNELPPLAGSVSAEDGLITMSGTAANWSFKIPALGEQTRSGSAGDWIWRTFREDGIGLTVPRSLTTNWSW